MLDYVTILFGCFEQLNRQNWDHIHVSDEVKRKRAAKKAKQYSVWLSIEISDVATSTLRHLRHIPRQSEKARDDVDRCICCMMDLIRYQEQKFMCRNATAMLQRISKICAMSGLQDYVVAKYGSILASLFVLIKAKESEIDPRQISEIMWSCGKLGRAVLKLRAPSMDLKTVGEAERTIDVAEFVASLIDKSEELRDSFTPTDVLVFTRGVIDLPYPEGHMAVARLLACLESKVTEFNGQDVSNLLWCLTRPGIDPQDSLVAGILAHAQTVVQQMTTQGLANTVWALAKMDTKNCAKLLAGIVNSTEDRLESFKPQEIANMTWGLARLRFRPTLKMLSRLADVSVDRHRFFNSQEICNLLEAFAVFGFQHPKFLSASQSKFMALDEGFSLRDTMSVVQSFAILDFLDDDFLSVALSRASEYGIDNMMDFQRCQLYQGILHLRMMCPQSQACQRIPDEIENACCAAWILQEEHTEPDDVSKEVLRVMSESGLAQCSVCNSIGPSSAFLGSTVTTNDGTQFVLQIMTSNAQFTNQPELETGLMKWREKMLAASGLFMLKVDPAQWCKFRSYDQKVGYLKKQL